MSKYQDLANVVIKGDLKQVKQITQQMLDAGEEPLAIINEGLIPGINEVGLRFKEGEMFVPEMMMAAQAMKGGVELVKPQMGGSDMPTAGKVVIGTVKGDLHDIGKNLVIMMMESSGFNVVDLGVDVSVEKFIQAVKDHNPQVVGMSALLTTTMPIMKEVIKVLNQENLRNAVKVVIGGAPVSKEYADEIGADGYAGDAVVATEICKQLLN